MVVHTIGTLTCTSMVVPSAANSVKIKGDKTTHNLLSNNLLQHTMNFQLVEMSRLGFRNLQVGSS